jgi:hypothetical protein
MESIAPRQAEEKGRRAATSLYAMKQQVLGRDREGLPRCAVPREAEACEAKHQHDPSGGFGHGVGWRIDCRHRECRHRAAIYRGCEERAKKSGAVFKQPDDLAPVIDAFGIRKDCARHVDCGEDAICVEEAGATRVVAEVACDLAPFVDARGNRKLARRLDWGEDASRVIRA